MASYNRVVLLGNVTLNIELRYTQSGAVVTDVGLAVNDREKKGTDWVEVPTFVDVTLWNRSAEVAHQYLSKGSPVLIEGRLKMESWEDRDTGKKRSRLKVVAEKLLLLPTGSGNQDGSSESSDAVTQSEPTDVPTPSADDIPF